MRKIPVGSEKFALVDDADYDWLNQFMWTLDSYGYVRIDYHLNTLCDNPISDVQLMHRLILGLNYGDPRECDHINHNPQDNRRCNLRRCSRSQNQHNQKIRFGTTSKFKGVCWNKQNKKWQAQIKINMKSKGLGLFNKEKYAAHAYNLAAKRYFGEFALLNKI